MAVVSESRFSFVLSAGAGGRVSEELQSPTATARVTQGRWGGQADGWWEAKLVTHSVAGGK